MGLIDDKNRLIHNQKKKMWRKAKERIKGFILAGWKSLPDLLRIEMNNPDPNAPKQRS